MEGSRHCHHLRLLDKFQLGDLSHKDWMPVPPWMEKNPPFLPPKIWAMSHEYWLLMHVFRHEHRLENGYGSSLFTDFTIPSKSDGELNTQKSPTFYGFSGSERNDLSGPKPRTAVGLWDSGGLSECSLGAEQHQVTHPLMEAGRWQRTYLSKITSRKVVSVDKYWYDWYNYV